MTEEEDVHAILDSVFKAAIDAALTEELKEVQHVSQEDIVPLSSRVDEQESDDAQLNIPEVETE